MFICPSTYCKKIYNIKEHFSLYCFAYRFVTRLVLTSMQKIFTKMHMCQTIIVKTPIIPLALSAAWVAGTTTTHR